jgi:hypothetical protein
MGSSQALPRDVAALVLGRLSGGVPTSISKDRRVALMGFCEMTHSTKANEPRPFMAKKDQ